MSGFDVIGSIKVLVAQQTLCLMLYEFKFLNSLQEIEMLEAK